METKPKILLVDDEPGVLLTLEAILAQEGYDVNAVNGGAEALAAIREGYYDLVLTDLKMPGVDGLAVLAEVQKRSPQTVTIMMTGYGSLGSALEAVQLGAYEYLVKPTEVAELKVAMRRSLERKRLSEIDTLYQVSRVVATSLEVETIASAISEAVERVLGLAYFCLVTFRRDGSTERCEDGLLSAFADPGLLAQVASGPVLLPREETPPALRQWAQGQQAGAVLLVPGIANQRLVCVLCAHNGAQNFELHAAARRFLQSLADQAALALESASLVAELRQNNQELAAANQKLQELDKLKSQFLSVATHELRTPLTILLGYNSMLEESLQSRLTPEEKGTLHESSSACKRLIRLVNSMLDINQIDSGRMQMNFAPADLRQLISGVVALFQHEARSRKIKLRSVAPAKLPRAVLDGERIQQVLINLVGNALKFTPSDGEVQVSVRHRPDQQAVQIAVRDTGTGIAPEDQERIFDEFAQVGRQIALRQRDGSGLGLAIAKRIVEAHHGSIKVSSTPGQGSTFTFTIPLASREEWAADAVTA
jgi:signal transduction histidine kinase/ActR/RegA family two-component response regulator